MCAQNATKHLIRKHISISTLITDTQTRSHNLFANHCQKTFELKKVWQEHNRHLHNTNDYKYLCNTCSCGFFHLGEFKAHRAKHTNIKPFTCGICKNASFAVISRLQKHLKTCGKEGNVECKKSAKLFSDLKSLNTHISEVHNDTIYTCEICEDHTYTSQGGYYRHMCSMHNIGRNGQKLSKM